MVFEKTVAIDGPGGSGKSTIAKLLAERLSLLYVDTGSMFRALGLCCHENSIEFVDNNKLQSFITSLKLEYKKSDHTSGIYIGVNGVDLTEKIREHHVSSLASKISQLQSVRSFLLEFQREVAKENICIMEGRDIGTVVFPKSFCKIYITASLDIRAKRRLNQLKGNRKCDLTLEEVIEDIKERDYRDTNREIAPLKQADDAYFLDTSKMDTNEVLLDMEKYIKECALKNSIKL